MVNVNRAKVAKISEDHKSPYLGKDPSAEPVQFKDNNAGDDVENPVLIDEKK